MNKNLVGLLLTLTITVVGLTAITINTLNVDANYSVLVEEMYTITGNEKVKEVKETTQKEIIIKDEEALEIRTNGYMVSYIVANSRLSNDEASKLVNTVNKVINKYNNEVPSSLIFAIMQTETDFRNIKSSFKSEDSVGYIQMQSTTREFLKNKYPNLPNYNSQVEFMSDVEGQIEYAVHYIKMANEKFNSNPECVISSYNMGLNNTKINNRYVKETLQHKLDLEQHLYVAK